jgi:CRISPR system Cascade subunit CasA
MSRSDRATFDLIHEPCIRVRDLGGGLAEYGVLRTPERAHCLAGLSGDAPTQTFALIRMLLAILHGALQGPQDDGQWQELWGHRSCPSHGSLDVW